jgi:hypothetical protein
MQGQVLSRNINPFTPFSATLGTDGRLSMQMTIMSNGVPAVGSGAQPVDGEDGTYLITVRPRQYMSLRMHGAPGNAAASPTAQACHLALPVRVGAAAAACCFRATVRMRLPGG